MTTSSAQAAIDELLTQLSAAVTQDRAEQEKRYLKSPIDHLGVSLPQTRRVTRSWIRGRDLNDAQLWELVQVMWASNWYEVRSAAVEVLVVHSKSLERQWFDRLRSLIDTTFTWALVDPLSTDVTAILLATIDRAVWEPILMSWSADPNFWVRRASMLSQLRALRHPDFDASLFFGFADAMLDEKEFFIRKAIGWILRDMSKRRPDDVEQWMRPRIERMSAVTYREAVKYLPPEVQDEFNERR